jgi:predicted permease
MQMESIFIALQVVVPLFVLMAIGFYVRQLKIIPAAAFSHINALCFKIFLPTLLFKNIVSADLSVALNYRVMLFVASAQILSMVLVLAIVPRIVKPKSVAAACAQGLFRSNFVTVGVALVIDIIDADGLALVSLLGAVTVPLFNLCSIIILESLRGGKIGIKGFAKNILTNPLIIGSVLGIIFLALDIPLGGLAQKCVANVAQVATPLAIVCLGGFFTIVGARERLKPVIIGVVGRLIIIPALALFAAYLLGFRGSEYLALIPVFIAPTAVASLPMAEQMGADPDTAALIIVITTVFSLVTMAFWLAITHYNHIW